jgi:hypothetical protein
MASVSGVSTPISNSTPRFIDSSAGRLALAAGGGLTIAGLTFAALRLFAGSGATEGAAQVASKAPGLGALGAIIGLGILGATAVACTAGGGAPAPAPAPVPQPIDPPTSSGDDPVVVIDDPSGPIYDPPVSDGDDPIIDPPVSDGDDPIYDPPIGSGDDPYEPPLYVDENPHGYVWPTGDVNCSDPGVTGDYADWLLQMDPSDPFRLDTDHDGIPCEDKPRGTDPVYDFQTYLPGDAPSGYEVYDPANPHGYAWPTHDVNVGDISGDYADWLLAQDPSDPFNLDGDNDGIPAEGSPRGTDPYVYYNYGDTSTGDDYGYGDPDFD